MKTLSVRMKNNTIMSYLVNPEGIVDLSRIVVTSLDEELLLETQLLEKDKGHIQILRRTGKGIPVMYESIDAKS